MKPLFVVAAALAVVSLTSAEVASVCDTCQMHVGNFVKAAHNKERMMELKTALSVLCAQTRFEADCTKLVHRLDVLVPAVAPYLADTHSVCSSLQACPEPKLSGVPRLMMLFFKQAQGHLVASPIVEKEVCDECHVASTQLHEFFSNKIHVVKAISLADQHICSAVGDYHQMCSTIVRPMLSNAFLELAQIFAKKEAVCADFKFCSTGKSALVKPVKTATSLAAIWSKADTITSQAGMSCLDCKVAVDSLLDEMILKRQTTADGLQKKICGKAPDAWAPGCNDFFHMYMSTVLYLTYNQFSGPGICAKMQTCPSKTPELYTKSAETRANACQSCPAVQQFLAEHAAEMHPFVAESLSESCASLPVSFHQICERVTLNMSGRFLETVAELSKKANLCAMAC